MFLIAGAPPQWVETNTIRADARGNQRRRRALVPHIFVPASRHGSHAHPLAYPSLDLTSTIALPLVHLTVPLARSIRVSTAHISLTPSLCFDSQELHRARRGACA